MEEGGSELCGAFFIGVLIPFMKLHPHVASQRLHLQIPSPWGLGFNMYICGGHKHSDHNKRQHFDGNIFHRRMPRILPGYKFSSVWRRFMAMLHDLNQPPSVHFQSTQHGAYVCTTSISLRHSSAQERPPG